VIKQATESRSSPNPPSGLRRGVRRTAAQ